MNTKGKSNHLITLNIMSVVMLSLPLFYLTNLMYEGIAAPILLFMIFLLFGVTMIFIFSKEEILMKLKIFIFFFSFYLFYIVIHDYILLVFSEKEFPFDYPDENTFYFYSNLGISYISGEKDFFDLFTIASYPLHEQPLYVTFISSIAYLSIMIDGSNTVMAQKMLSPFLGGMFSVFLYSALKYQFNNQIFILNATVAYSSLSVVFMYSTTFLRDIDVALAYMIFFTIFLRKNNIYNLILLVLVAFSTLYLRLESGMVLFALILVYCFFYVRTLENTSIKYIFYIFILFLFFIVFILMYGKIAHMIVGLNEANTSRAIEQSSSDSISLLFNKLPFPLSYIAKVLFGQMQPFPFIMAIDRPAEALSGIFWPFIFIMMLYAMINKNIRINVVEKIKYLLIISIVILFLMSSEPMARRMMSVYPIIYIVSLYAFLVVPKNIIKIIFYYYLFGIISLNVFYYLIKI